MDFLVCVYTKAGLALLEPMKDIESVEAAILSAEEFASRRRGVGCKVILYTSEDRLVCGWTVLEDSKLRLEPNDMLQDEFCNAAGLIDWVK